MQVEDAESSEGRASGAGRQRVSRVFVILACLTVYAVIRLVIVSYLRYFGIESFWSLGFAHWGRLAISGLLGLIACYWCAAVPVRAAKAVHLPKPFWFVAGGAGLGLYWYGVGLAWNLGFALWAIAGQEEPRPVGALFFSLGSWISVAWLSVRWLWLHWDAGAARALEELLEAMAG